MIRRAQPWLGTLVEISVVDQAGPSASHICVAINAAFTAISLVHRCMSFHEANSDLSAINRLGVGDSVVVDAITAEVLRCAGMLEEASHGIFNAACGQRLASWGYLPAPAVLNSTSATAPDQALPRAVITVDAQSRVTRSKPGWIDLGGIAKGYAVDRAVATLQAHGIGAACVNAGGDLRAFGQHAFEITVRDPRILTQAGRILALQDQALATSACYFSRRDSGGITHTALINGADGQAVVNRTSVSVQAPNCMLADGLTKIVMATGNVNHPLLKPCAATAFII